MKKIVFYLMTLAPTLALAFAGPYASIQTGVNWVAPDANWTTSGVTQTSQNDSFGMVGGGAAGFLWGNNTINYGLEADALTYPDSNSSGQLVSGVHRSIKYDGYNLSLLAVLEYTNPTGFTAFVKAGGAYVSQQVTVTCTGTPTVTNDAHDFAPEAQVGVGYFITPQLEADATYDEVFAGSQDNFDTNQVDDSSLALNNVAENRNFLLGLKYHFCFF